MSVTLDTSHFDMSILNDVGTIEYMDRLANDYATSSMNLLKIIKIDKVYVNELQELIEFLLNRNS